MEQNFFHIPVLSTKRLILRKLCLEDQDEIFELHSDERVLEFLDRPKYKNLEDASKFINDINKGLKEREWIYWGIISKETDRLIGTICFWHWSGDYTSAEIGYELLPSFQGKGIMQEALTKVLDYGFHQLKLHYVEAYIQAKNIKSIRLLERNHFQFVRAEKEEEKLKKPPEVEMLIYILKNKDT